jgi:hypothetical protein
MRCLHRFLAAGLIGWALAGPTFVWAADENAATTCGAAGQHCCDSKPRCGEGAACVSQLCPAGVTCPPGQCVAVKPPAASMAALPSQAQPDDTCHANKPCASGICYHNHCMPVQTDKYCHNNAGCDSLRVCVKRPATAEVGSCEYQGGLYQRCTADERCNSGGQCLLGRCVPPATPAL